MPFVEEELAFYRVFYIFNDTIDNTLTESNLSGTTGTIGSYPDKCPSDYYLLKEETKPLVNGEVITYYIHYSNRINFKIIYNNDRFNEYTESTFVGTYKSTLSYNDIESNSNYNNIPFPSPISYYLKSIDGVPLTLDNPNTNYTITIHYDVIQCNLNVNYFYDNKKDNNETEVIKKDINTKLSSYTPSDSKNKNNKYLLNRIEGLPISFNDNTKDYIINIYYDRFINNTQFGVVYVSSIETYNKLENIKDSTLYIINNVGIIFEGILIGTLKRTIRI